MNYWQRWTTSERVTVAMFASGLVVFGGVTLVRNMPSPPPAIQFYDAPAAPVAATNMPPIVQVQPQPNPVVTAPPPKVQLPQSLISPPGKQAPQAAQQDPPARVEQPAAPVNINTASAVEMESLPGIGPVIAQRIVEYRQQYGPFTAVEQLAEVKGVGPKKLEKIKMLIIVR